MQCQLPSYSKQNQLEDELDKYITNVMRQFHIFHATGVDRFKEVEVQPREYAGFVQADSLEKAFEYAQNDHVDWAMYQIRSTSVGDVIQDDNTLYMVCGIGFKELIEEEDLASIADKEEEMKYQQ